MFIETDPVKNIIATSLSDSSMFIMFNVSLICGTVELYNIQVTKHQNHLLISKRNITSKQVLLFLAGLGKFVCILRTLKFCKDIGKNN